MGLPTIEYIFKIKDSSRAVTGLGGGGDYCERNVDLFSAPRSTVWMGQGKKTRHGHVHKVGGERQNLLGAKTQWRKSKRRETSSCVQL